MTERKIRTRSHSRIAFFAIFALALVVLAGVMIVAGKPTAAAERKTNNIIHVYGLGSDDVSLLVDGKVYPAETVSHAENHTVYTYGLATFEYDGKEYEAIFRSEVAQGKGYYETSFSLEEAQRDNITVYGEAQPEYCTMTVIVGQK